MSADHQSWAEQWLTAMASKRSSTKASPRPGPLEISPGVARMLHGSTQVLTTSVHVGLLSAEERQCMVDSVTSSPAIASSCLLGELQPSLGERWRDHGVALIGSHEQWQFDCTCREWGTECRHFGVLITAIAEAIEADPYVLFSLRGWSRDQFVSELRRRRGAPLGDRRTEPRGPDLGVSAADAFAATPSAIPHLPSLDRRPGRPAPFLAPPIDAGIDPDDLAAVAHDAARRAHGILGEGADPGLYLDEAADRARRAATAGDTQRAALAQRWGVDPQQLTIDAWSWRVGGRAGLTAMHHRWGPTDEQLRPGMVTMGPGHRINANRIIRERVALLLDAELRWWLAQTDDRLGWVLTAGPANDPRELPDPAAQGPPASPLID